MFESSKVRLRLRAKLTLTYFGVGLVLTLVNVWSTRWVQQRAEEAAADRTRTVQLAEELATLASSTMEEGFGFVLSGDVSEKEACLRKLERFGILRQRLIDRQGVRDEEAGVLIRLDASLKRAVESTHRMFQQQDAERHVERQSFEAYEASMDAMSDEVQQLAAGIRQRVENDNSAARQRLHGVQLGVAGIAALLAVSMGTVFGLQLTRPLLALRVAAARLGRGELEFELQPSSGDELGEVTTAFADMAANVRSLLATVADQKRHLEDVFASLGEMVLVCAPDGTITSSNDSVGTTLGYGEEELIGRGLDTLLDSACFEDLRRRAMGRDTLAGAVPAEAELRLRRKDGRHVVVAVSASLLRTNSREYAGVICVAQDISERLRLEAELRQAQKLQAIGRLASGVAHEINTPVQFVNDSVHFARDGVTDMARLIGKYQAGARALEGTPAEEVFAEARHFEKESDLPYLLEKLPSAVERAIQGLDRIAAIVRSMKVFAHPGQTQMVPVDLNHAVRSTLTVAQSEYKHVADLETDFGELPLVTCHGGEINQAVLNLVVNAAHAIADDSKPGTRGRIMIRTRRDGDSVVVSIGDTGPGIPEEIRDQIFDPFFTTKDVGKGTGQGLSVARSAIVEKHRGQLTFETEPGKGTTFHIRLPIGGAEAPRDIPKKAPVAA